MSILSPIAVTQMLAEAMLGRLRVGIIAIVQQHQLNIAKHDFNWVVVGTAFGQTDPMQAQRAHDTPRVARLARMSAILIERDPERLIWEPAPQAAHELTYVTSALARKEAPIDSPLNRIVGDEQIEQTACFLRSREHQFLGGGVTPAAIGFHGNRFHIKEDQPAPAR